MEKRQKLIMLIKSVMLIPWLCLGIVSVVSAADNYLMDNDALTDGEFLPSVWYYEDKSESATLKQVQTIFTQHGFHAAPVNFNAGIGQSTHWFKVQIEIAPAFDADRYPQLFMEISDPILDYIDIYHFNNGQELETLRMGASLPFDLRIFNSPTFVVPITIASGDHHEFWIRVNTSNSMHFPVKVLTPNQYAINHNRYTIFYGSIFGMTLIMIAYNALMGWRVRSIVYLYYSGVLLGGLLHRMYVSGLGYQLFWPGVPGINEYLRPFTDNILAFFSIMFTQKLLNTRQFSPLLNRWLSYMAIVAVVAAASVFFLPSRYALNIALWILLIAFLFEYVIGIEFWLLGVKHSTLFLVGWFVFLSGSIILIFAVFGAIPMSGFTAHAAELGFAVHILALSFALSDQINYMQQEKLQAQDESARAQEELLSIQIRLNEDLDRQVRLRTEELEQANQRLNLLNTTDELTGLHNRRYLNEVLPKEYKRAVRDQQPLAIMMLDIDHFKKLNDTYGHQFGDEVLRQAAMVFKSCIRRPPDIAVRYGGEEFMVILPNTSSEGASIVAEQIRQKVANTLVGLNDQTTGVTVSIGIAVETPSKDGSEEELIRRADEMLYRAKENGRNRIEQA